MLQGTLDDFSLDEVLGLLSATDKSGRLRLSGDRGTGSLWLQDGGLTAAEASKIPGNADVEDVMFEMLRYGAGTFSFTLNDIASEPSDPEDVSDVVAKAQERLGEWLAIAEVVPSLQHIIRLSSALPEDELSISELEWRTIVAIGEKSAVEPVCDHLGFDEVDGSRQVMQMIERGLLDIAEPAVETPESDVVVPPTSQTVAPPMPRATRPAPPVPHAPQATPSPQAAPAASAQRPPMPAPPSPSEIASFSAKLDSQGAFDPSDVASTNATEEVTDEDESVLMRYLQADQ